MEGRYLNPEKECMKYNISIDAYRTILSVMKNNWEKKRKEELIEEHEEGFSQGYIEGYIEATIEIATKMKEDGRSVEFIQRYTYLTAEDIERL